MRYTPQPRVAPGSGVNQQNEVTRISDSIMPGTAVNENALLRDKVDELKSELLRRDSEYREKEIMWDEQQTEHENRSQDFRKLKAEKAEIERAHESMVRSRDRLREQCQLQTMELAKLRDDLQAQRNVGLASFDEKEKEITHLREELEVARAERDKATKSVQSTEETFEFTKEQYRKASQTAGQLQTENETLTSQIAKLSQEASGERVKLKQLHIDRTTKNILEQAKRITHENTHLKAALKQKEEEIIRAKANGGRMAYGTRGQSTTPQPKTRSRATSPSAERGARLPRGGRMSHLVNQER